MAAPHPTTQRQRWGVLGVLCLSLLVVSIDNGILNVALPTLVRDLGASPSQLQWIIDAYTLVFAGLLLTAGNLGDRYGRKQVMTVGLWGLGLASVAAAWSSSPTQLAMWRAVLGIGAALIMPATLSILVNVFTDPTERRRAIAYWSLMNAAGGFLGPITGGFLLRYFSWRACFFVNVPFVILALVLGRWFVPTSRDPESARFDVLGALLSTSGLAVVLWCIIEGPEVGWSDPLVVGGFVLSALLFSLFVVCEQRVRAPMLDLSLLREPQLSAAALAMAMSFIALTGVMFLVTQSMQLVKGHSPLVAAISISGPLLVINLLVMPRTPRLMGLVGARWMICGGSCAVAVASLTISLTSVDSGYANLLVGFCVMALGFSVFVPASTEAMMAAVPPEKSGNASSINQLSRQIGQALGIAVCGSIAASRYSSSFPEASPSLAAVSGEQLDEARDSIGAALRVARGLGRGADEALRRAAETSFVHGLRAAAYVGAVLAVLAALFGALAIPGRHRIARHLRSGDETSQGETPQGEVATMPPRTGEESLHQA